MLTAKATASLRIVSMGHLLQSDYNAGRDSAAGALA
jgi:hypothetical protein